MKIGDQVIDHLKCEAWRDIEIALVLYRDQPVILINARFQRPDRGRAHRPNLTARVPGLINQVSG